MTRIVANGIDINYQEQGAGFPLVLIHGLSDSSALWAPLMSELSRYYRVIALDVRGHGESEKPDMPYSIQLFSEDLLCFLENLKLSNAHLLGLSLGAAVAQQFALDHSDKVRSLVLLSPFSHSDPDLRNKLVRLREIVARDGLFAFFDTAIRLVVTPEFIAANADAIAQMKKECVRINSPGAILRVIDACMDFNLKGEIQEISHPTLIVSGRGGSSIANTSGRRDPSIHQGFRMEDHGRSGTQRPCSREDPRIGGDRARIPATSADQGLVDYAT